MQIVEELINTGKAKLENSVDEESSAEAVKAFNQAISIKPELIKDLGELLIVAYRRLRNYEEAILVYERMPIVTSEIWAKKGMLYFWLGKYEKSLEAFEKAISLGWNLTKTIASSQAEAYYKQGNYEAAELSYNKAILLTSDDLNKLEYLCLKGNLLLSLERYQEALVCYENAFTIYYKLSEPQLGSRFTTDALHINYSLLLFILKKKQALKFFNITCERIDKQLADKTNSYWHYSYLFFKSILLSSFNKLYEANECYSEIALDEYILYFYEDNILIEQPDIIFFLKQNFSSLKTYYKILKLSNHPNAYLISSYINRIWKNYENERQYLEKILKDEPTNAYVLCNLGVAYINLNKMENAVSCFKAAIEYNGMNKLTEVSAKFLFKNLGIALSKLGLYEEALKCYKRILLIDPKCYYTLLCYGEILNKMHLDEEALEHFNKALLYKSTHLPLYIGKSNSLNKLGKFKESLKCCEYGLLISPHNRELLEAKEMAVLGLQHEGEIKISNDLTVLEKELTKLDEQLKTTPSCAYSYKCKGNILSRIDRNEEAIIAYKKSIELEPDYIVAYFGYGDILLKLGRDKEAIAIYDKAILLRPNEAIGYIHKGNMLAKFTKYEEALQVFTESIENCKNTISLNSNKANVLIKKGEFEEAKLIYNKLLTLNPKNVNWLISKADILKYFKRYQEAEELYNQALKQEPNNIHAISGKALITYINGKNEEAFKLLKEISNLDITNVNVAINLGHALYEIGNYKEAIKIYDKAINLEKGNTTASESKQNAIYELSKIASEQDIGYLIKNIPLSVQARSIALQKSQSIKTIEYDSSEKSRNLKYLRDLLKLPWGKYSKINIDINTVKKELEKNHYGLETVKNKIIESLVFMARSKEAKPPIICLVGAPGVGKTSIANSIANALQRKTVRLSLAGASDSGLIRGCMSYYTGSHTGKVMSLISEAGTCNPVMILDEIDKIDLLRGKGVEGALLQVIDPSQNNNFIDEYFDFTFDLSKVLFIATANSINQISYALLHRMEIIEISGYTDNEKLEIAQNYILPKILKEANLNASEFFLEKEIIQYLITYHTQESGVRDIERLLRELVQKYLVDILQGKQPVLNKELIQQYFSLPRYNLEYQNIDLEIGVVNGLSCSAYGGNLITVEASKYAGKGAIKTTGKLGEILKESIEAAYGYLKSHYKELNINEEDFSNYDLHIHFPEGATPKDGPSAGITIYTAIASLLSGKKINSDIAMTGEITLKGRVLPIGGLKEKLTAAVRRNVRTVIIPEANKRDLIKIPDEIKRQLTIKTISYAKELLEIVFLQPN